MALDHYVSQVHLKNFYSPALGELMYAIRKSDLKMFTPSSKVVCTIQNGSTNAYLQKDRAIEEFLRTIEPNYNTAIEKLRTGAIDAECIYTLAGFAAFVISCSPAAMRIHSGPLRNTWETTSQLLDANGKIPPPPASLGGASLSELLSSGKVRIHIDPKYPQAMGISNVLAVVTTFGNSEWDVLLNDHSDSPYFTSDFPAAIEDSGDPRILYRIIPLSPKIAIRIKPDINLDRRNADFSFSRFRCRKHRITRREALTLNRAIVRCAEDLVFYRDDHPWVKPFVKRNQRFRIEPTSQQFPAGDGVLMLTTQRCREFSAW